MRQDDTQRTALLIMVHGSPRPESNADMYRAAESIRVRGLFRHVAVGFLECNDPRIPEAVEECADLGCSRIIAVPYFLHTGNHVANDLPDLLAEAEAAHPAIEFRLGQYIGANAHITEVLARRARDVSGEPLD